MQIFAGLLEGEALSWYLSTSFSLWKELENEFVQTWCVYMSSTTAIVEVAKVYQKKYEHIRVYASKFEELHCFSGVLNGGGSYWFVLKQCEEIIEGACLRNKEI